MINKQQSASNYLFLCVIIKWRKYAVRQKSAIFRNKQVFTAIYIHKHAEKIQTHRHTCTIMVQEAKKKVLLIFSQESLHLACPCEPTIGIRLARNPKQNIFTWKLHWLLFDHSMSNWFKRNLWILALNPIPLGKGQVSVLM